MKKHTVLRGILLVCVLTGVTVQVVGNPKKEKDKQAEVSDATRQFPRASCISSEMVNADSVCANNVNANNICTNNLDVKNRICTADVEAVKAAILNLQAQDACIAGTLSANNALLCSKYKATVVFGSNTLYTLGSPLNFNVILDDLNGNVTVSPFTYTAPVSGYYVFTVQVDSRGLVTTGNVLGIPISNLQVYVNNVLFRQDYAPFLTFSDVQATTLTALIKLKKGDVVTAAYNLLVVDSTSGFTPLAGTILIQGNGTDENESLFKIHLLSADCSNSPLCPPVTVCGSTAPCPTCPPCCVPCVH